MVNRELTQSLNDSISSGSLQLRILLHQLLQAEAWKLYRNLGFFAFSLALVHRSFAVLRMPHPLSRTKSALPRRLFHRRRFRHRKLLPPAREEFRNVLDRVIGSPRHGWFRRARAPRISPMPAG